MRKNNIRKDILEKREVPLKTIFRGVEVGRWGTLFSNSGAISQNSTTPNQYSNKVIDDATTECRIEEKKNKTQTEGNYNFHIPVTSIGKSDAPDGFLSFIQHRNQHIMKKVLKR